MSVDADLVEADRVARTEALDVGRSFIVQAPAGSGKTELLIQRYLKLLSHVEQPEEVVAITFTRKAAQEMQSRAMAAIRDALHGVTATEPHEEITLDAARRVLDRDRSREWQLLESPRRMRIQTLDGFNAAIARSLPFSSGLGGAGRIVADDEMEGLYRRAASATLDWLSSEGETSEGLERVLAHLDNNTGVYISYLSRMLATRDQWIPITGAGPGDAGNGTAIRASLERNIAAEVCARLQQVRRLLPSEQAPRILQAARYATQNLEAQNGLSVLAACEELPASDAAQLEAWRALCNLLLTKSGSWRKSVNKNDGFPPGDAGEKKQLVSLLQDLASEPGLCETLHSIRQLPDARYTDAQWEILLALFRLLPLAVGELRRLFSEQNVTDHTEVAMAAAAALGSVDEPGEKSLLLDFTIRHLLIDEMQDTSIAQYRFIEQLVSGWERGDGKTLFCVGDPMQSIYRFRNAEVGQFLLAREDGIGAVALEPLVLRQNFRSGERLVKWFNEVFHRIFPLHDNVSSGAIAYSPSVPALQGKEPDYCRIYPLADASDEEEAEQTVEVIRRCLDAPQDQATAVLVRSRARLPLLLSRLREAKLDYQAIEIDRLTDLPEIIDVLALTRALVHCGDRIAWLGLLRGPLVGLTWKDLHRLVSGQPRATIWELLQNGDRLRQLSVEAQELLNRFKGTMAPFVTGHATRSLRESVEQAWYALRGPLLLRNREETDNVYRFFDVLEGMDVAGSLCDVAELESRLDQERVSGRDAAGCRLQIMTMHKAKGLQFDHVILYGLGRAAKTDEKSILSWLNLPDGKGGTSMIISPVGARAEAENDPLHYFVEAAHRAKSRLEQNRLLYVACTRARRSLHLIGHVALNDEGICSPREGTLLHCLWPGVRSVFEQTLSSASRTDKNSSALRTPLFGVPLLRRLKPDCEIVPPPLPFRAMHPDKVIDELPVSFNWVGTVARHAGTLVHRWLHRISSENLVIGIEQLDALRPLAHNEALELGVPLRDVDAVCKRALQALRNILEDPKGRWILFGPGASEMPVTGIWKNRVESIVIDRVRIDAEGIHWIVDYKTSTHEGGDLEAFLLQEGKRYEPQLAKYAELYQRLLTDPDIRVRTALYFPLLQEFRELDVLTEAAPA